MMDRWMNGWMDGGWMNWTDGWKIDGWMDECVNKWMMDGWEMDG